MILILSTEAQKDYNYFKQANPKIARRIKNLLEDIMNTPFTGIGKPEPLRFALSGYWPGGINDGHSLDYRAEEDKILIVSCRYHYK